jgi:hypothetical protein
VQVCVELGPRLGVKTSIPLRVKAAARDCLLLQ